MIDIVLLTVGFVILIKGADYFVDGASSLAQKFNIPQVVIGLTVVAMGTSAPEAAVSISAVLRGSADITVGNVIGSNIINVLLILGVTAFVAPIAVDRGMIRKDVPFVLMVTILFGLMGVAGGCVGRIDGFILLALFSAYMITLFRGKREEDTTIEIKERKTYKTILLCVFGLAMVVGGSRILVDGAVGIAEAMDISQRIIGLTIVAFGTSLPEMVTSITAARKGNSGIAIGNIIGSNIFNILFVVGITASISPIAFASAFTMDTLVSIASVLLLMVVSCKGELSRKGGLVMLLSYGLYVIYSVLV